MEQSVLFELRQILNRDSRLEANGSSCHSHNLICAPPPPRPAPFWTKLCNLDILIWYLDMSSRPDIRNSNKIMSQFVCVKCEAQFARRTKIYPMSGSLTVEWMYTVKAPQNDWLENSRKTWELVLQQTGNSCIGRWFYVLHKLSFPRTVNTSD